MDTVPLFGHWYHAQSDATRSIKEAINRSANLNTTAIGPIRNKSMSGFYVVDVVHSQLTETDSSSTCTIKHVNRTGSGDYQVTVVKTYDGSTPLDCILSRDATTFVTITDAGLVEAYDVSNFTLINSLAYSKLRSGQVLAHQCLGWFDVLDSNGDRKSLLTLSTYTFNKNFNASSVNLSEKLSSRVLFWDYLSKQSTGENNGSSSGIDDKACVSNNLKNGLKGCYYYPCGNGILGIDKQGQVWLFRVKIASDFPGPQYPVGFQLIQQIETYYEKEEELDIGYLPGTYEAHNGLPMKDDDDEDNQLSLTFPFDSIDLISGNESKDTSAGTISLVLTATEDRHNPILNVRRVYKLPSSSTNKGSASHNGLTILSTTAPKIVQEDNMVVDDTTVFGGTEKGSSMNKQPTAEVLAATADSSGVSNKRKHDILDILPVPRRVKTGEFMTKLNQMKDVSLCVHCSICGDVSLW